MSEARTTRKFRELRSGMVRRNEVQSKHIWCFLLGLIVAQLAAMRLVCISKVGGRKKKEKAERLSPFFVRVHIAEIGLKFDCDAFMSSADDCYLALLCRMFAKNTFIQSITERDNY